MPTDYDDDSYAENYQESKTLLWRSRIEDPSFLGLIGNVAGKTVLDFACGEGHFTRMLRAAGAGEVVGVDLSERMIELARQQEEASPIGITYQVDDARKPAPAPHFDVVAAAWLLVYARNRDELAEMCRGVASRLKPGGRFITVITNPDVVEFGSKPDYRKYHFAVEAPAEPTEGAPIRIILQLSKTDLPIENYYLPLSVYESALAEAGFTNVRVHQPRLSVATEHDGDFWDEFMRYPLFVLIEGERQR
jgi:SAM-dependent methyltransferase